MEPLYYQTPYVKEFDAIVTACRPAKHGFEVELSQTGFYPEGGGQPSDTGRIGEVHVTHVEEKHGVVVHETDAPLEVGSTVHAGHRLGTAFFQHAATYGRTYHIGADSCRIRI